MAWGIAVVTGKQRAWEESWDEQKQARDHKNWRMAILKGNMLVTSTTFRRATRSIFCLPILSVFLFSLSLWLLSPVLQMGNISGSELGQEHAEKHSWIISWLWASEQQAQIIQRDTETGIQQPPAYSHLGQSTGLDFNVCSSLGTKSLLWEAVP